MSSIFRKDDNYVDKLKRNTFDMSHQNNLTLKFGKLVPVLCQPVMPGDSVKIDPSFGLRYMPQVFPVQTRQRASIKYYYVRNRNLWDDWMDFIGRTKEGLTPPYFKFAEEGTSNGTIRYNHFLRPSSLADYLGVPIKVTSDNAYTDYINFAFPYMERSVGKYTYIPNSDIVFSNSSNDDSSIFYRGSLASHVKIDSRYLDRNFKLSDIYGGLKGVSDNILPLSTYDKKSDLVGIDYVDYKFVGFSLFRKAWKVSYGLIIDMRLSSSIVPYLIVRVKDSDGKLEDVAVSFDKVSITSSTNRYELSLDDLAISYVSDVNESVYMPQVSLIDSVVGLMYVSNEHLGDSQFIPDQFEVTGSIQDNPDLSWGDVAENFLPFCTEHNDSGVRISSLPFRAYESVYNALIRNAENNPLLINGQPEYNKYLRNTSGGAETDYNILKIKHCNWADDRFTTALPSPQQGNAPLVGLTGVHGATVVLGNPDGSQSTVKLEADAETGVVTMVRDVSSNSPEYLSDAMMSAVDFGITINDLRNVNSFQRWLENNIRRGYKYKDQLMSHYGVNARFDVLDMPEFIGGVTRDVNVEQVTQLVENEYGNLGDYAGQSYIMGDGQSIEHYCDEHGFIIGIMSVYPMPLYQDTLPKYLINNNIFDYYFPEFGKIGMQPITKKELAFSQSFFGEEMDDTFGYQRAWYDYLENLDSVHGAFRYDLRNYLIARDFASTPTLNADFLTIDSDDLNNTFYSDDDNDKIIGQVYHKMSMKRPIPEIGIPALE